MFQVENLWFESAYTQKHVAPHKASLFYGRVLRVVMGLAVKLKISNKLTQKGKYVNTAGQRRKEGFLKTSEAINP